MFWYGNLFNIWLQGDFNKMTNTKLARFKNNITFQNVFARLLQDALARYKFNNLPDTCSQRVILQSLLWYGSVVFWEKDGSVLALPGVPTGSGYNVYGDISESWVFSATGQFNQPVKIYIPGSDESSFLKNTVAGKQTGQPKGVLVRENAIMYPFMREVIYFSEVIADTLRTLDVCRTNMKQPFVITAEESIVNSVRKFFEKRKDNEEYIISSGVFPADKINLLPFDTNTDNLKNATELIDWYENKFRELCGVENNGQVDKKGENLIQSEVDINNEYTCLSLDKCIKYIQEGLDNVNKLFGTNITVEPNRKENDCDGKTNDIQGDDGKNTESVS